MRKVQISYALQTQGGEGRLRHALMDQLAAVHACGSISAAAQRLDLSYRHLWGELRRWETSLERPLIVWEKGQRARLTEFGLKLLWAERQAQARLAPQIDALQAELERAFAIAFDEAAHVLTLHASHDEALSLLREQAVAQSRLHLDVRFSGSVDAISDLNQGRCALAGFHVPRLPGRGGVARAVYQPLLRPGVHKLIGYATRQQGLMVAPGNPLGIRGLGDLGRGQARLVNRALGSGTRVLLDELLAGAGLRPEQVRGYGHLEHSHAAVAQAVATGAADVGLGPEASARARGLDFLPLIEEDYFLVCLRSALDSPAMQALRRLLRSPDWARGLSALPGYGSAQVGDVQSLRQELPWWDLPRRRTPSRSGTAG